MNTSYWKYVKQQFRRNRRGMVSLYIVGFLALVALFADFLADDKPIIAKNDGQWMFPIFQSYAVDMGWMKWNKKYRNVIWQDERFDFAIRPLIPYAPRSTDYSNKYKSPFATQEVASWHWRHWFGTAKDGEDVAAGMIHGTRVAFKVGIVAMSIAGFIGILLGGLAGFLGDDQVKVQRGRLWMLALFGVFALFYGVFVRKYAIIDAFEIGGGAVFLQFIYTILIIGAIMGLGWLMSLLLIKIPFWKRKMTVPVDIIISRIIEIFNSIPTLILILTFVAFVKKASIVYIMLIIGLVSWTGIARFMRGELLHIRSMPYIEAAKALGFSKWRIMLKHAIPNALSPVLIAIAFGIAASILLEATLSFLDLSQTEKMESWGGILQLSRKASPSDWWLAVFPGFAIFLTVSCFNFIGEGLLDAIDPKFKK